MKLFNRNVSFSRPKVNTVLIHAAVWACFLFFPFFFFRIRVHNHLLVLKMFISSIFLIFFFYVHYLILLPRYLQTRKITPYLLWVSAIILLILSADLLSEYLIIYRHRDSFMFVNPPGEVAHPGLTRLQLNSLRTFRRFSTERTSFFNFAFPITVGRVILASALALSISGAMRITEEWAKNEQQKHEMENDKLSSELNFLKSQVNPHFLFNTLNSIYSLAHRKSDQAPTAIVKLSQLMRYMLHESNDKMVSLRREVDYLNNYIDLQRMRLAQEVRIEFHTCGEIDDKMIEPMLFIHFVENAFKYGLNQPHPPGIDIYLSVQERQLLFRVENGYLRQPSFPPVERSGIGLHNITRRLNLLYPDRHTLEILQTDNRYTVELTLTLHV